MTLHWSRSEIHLHRKIIKSNQPNVFFKLQTSRTIVFNSNVDFIQFSNVDETLYYANFAGWGAKTEGGLESTKLYEINLTLPADCSSYSVYEKDYMICAGSGRHKIIFKSN